MNDRNKTPPGPPTSMDAGYQTEGPEALLDQALDAVPRRLAPVVVETKESAGLEAARYSAAPKALSAGIDTLPPQAAVVVQSARDVPTDPSKRVDNKPPPVTTDPTKPPVRSLWPAALVALLLLVLLVGVAVKRVWKDEPAVPSVATTALPTSTATPPPTASVTPVHTAPAPTTSTTAPLPSATSARTVTTASTPTAVPSAKTAPVPSATTPTISSAAPTASGSNDNDYSNSMNRP